MISKVKSVQANGTYDSQYGVLYKFDYEMEDGTSLSANHKSQTPFPVGTEVEYEIKGSTDYGNYGKVGKPQDGSFQKNGVQNYQKKSQGSTASFALSYAKDLVVAGKVDPDQLLQSATKLNNWLKENS